MSKTHSPHAPLKRMAALAATGLLVFSTAIAPNGVVLADIDKLEAQRDAANARADEASAGRTDAASRASAAETQRDAANAAAGATQAEIDEAAAYLDELFVQTEIAQEELGKANYDLSVTRDEIAALEEQIAQTEEELSKEQDNLSGQMAATYKSGPGYLLEMVLEATSFDDFISRVTYANKVSEYFSQTIQNIKDIRSELNRQHEALRAKEAEQEELVAIAEEKTAQAEAAQAAQEAYIDELSDELVAALEAARVAEAEASLARAEEAMYAEQEETARAEADEAQREADAERAAQEAARRAEAMGVAPYVGSYATGDQRAIAVNAALSQVGLPYIWGEELPGVGFDCNSLTHWAWAQAGVSIPYPSGTYSYGQFQWLKSSGRWVSSMGDLQPGDLVFYSRNGGISCYHVAMYLGGGMVVHANGYRYGVIVSSIDVDAGFCGGGSPV